MHQVHNIFFLKLKISHKVDPDVKDNDGDDGNGWETSLAEAYESVSQFVTVLKKNKSGNTAFNLTLYFCSE